jgi:hypothetical protein
MTEVEWLSCDDLDLLLESLRGKVSVRKLRLALCGWSRIEWKWLSQEGRSAVEVAELFADEAASDEARRDADAELWWKTKDRHNARREWLARLSLEGVIDLWAAAHDSTSRNPAIRQRQRAIVHDIFANPFRPVSVGPSWLTATVRNLAEQIYVDRSFDRLPSLADVLQDAGCNNDDILSHCRSKGPHVRGCWVVDAVLNKW